jgi:hypothetical protein
MARLAKALRAQRTSFAKRPTPANDNAPAAPRDLTGGWPPAWMV